MTKIKPCPFCGGHDVSVNPVYPTGRGNMPPKILYFEVRHLCADLSDDEFVTGFFRIRGRDEQGVIAAWNTRADATVAKAVAAERERCVAIVEAFKQANWHIPEGSEIGAQRSNAINLALDSVLNTIRRDSK